MKRPVIWFTLSFTVCALFQLHCSLVSASWPCFLLISLILVIAVVCCEFQRTSPLGVLLSGALCGFLLTAGYTQYLVRPVEALAEHSLDVQAVVADYPELYEDEQRVTLHIPASSLGITGLRPSIKTTAYLPYVEYPLQPGDQITTTLTFYHAEISDGFASRVYDQGNGVFVRARCAADKNGVPLPVHVFHPEQRPFWSYPLSVAHQLKERITTAMPSRVAGLTVAIMIGDKSGLTEDDQLALRKAGLSHVTAVSGMHIGFLVAFFYMVLGRKWGTILSIGAILFFIPMAGASPSVIRAGIMYLIAAIGFCIGKEHDGLNSLCVALTILLCLNPYALMNMSLLLSFSATLGLLLLSGRLQTAFMYPFQRMRKVPKKIIGFLTSSFACSISATAFTTPILFYSFGYVSIFAPIANLFVVSAVGVLFILGYLCGFLLLCSQTAGICAILLRPVASYILWAAQLVASFPRGIISWDNGFAVTALIAFYAVLMCLICLQKKWVLRATPVLCVFFIAMVICSAFSTRRTLTVTHLPSGAGQAIVVSYNRRCVVIDCGASGFRDASQAVREYMLWNDLAQIDTLILTSVDKTHARNAPALLKTLPVERIVLPPNIRETELSQELLQIATDQKVPITILDQTEEVLLTNSPANSIFLIGGIERKLGVRIHAAKTDQLILHGFTQNMLEKLLWLDPSLTADTIVLSEANLEDEVRLDKALEQLKPRQIIVQSGYSKMERILEKYTVQNTLLVGEITSRTYIKPNS